MPRIANGPARQAAAEFVEKGPYTLDEVKRLVRLCYEQWPLEKFELAKALVRCQSKFSAEEFEKLVRHSAKNYSDEWMTGCGEWFPGFGGSRLSSRTPDKLLPAYAVASELDGDGFGCMIEGMDWKGVTSALKTELLRIRKSQLIQRSKANAAKKRDQSPERK